LEERKQGKNPQEALQISIPTTFSGTLAASLNTSVAFGALLITHIRGFSHFGFIGGLGMFFCWVASYTVLPVFMSITEEIWPMVREGQKERFQLSLMAPLADHLTRAAKRITGIGALISLACVPLLVYFVPRSLEYDFSKLKVVTSSTEAKREQALNDRVHEIFSKSLSPAVVLTEQPEQTQAVCKEILRKNDLDPSDKRVVESCKSLYSYIPENQDQKLAILSQIHKLLEDNTVNFLNPDQKKELEKFKSQFHGEHIEVKDLPDSIVKNFKEKNGDLGKIVYVYPSLSAPLWNGKNLMRFSDIIRKVQLPTGETITASGESVIFSDLLQAVLHDGPRTTLLSFFAVCLVVGLIFRNREAFISIIGTLVVGVLWMGGGIALFNIKINFFNFIAIPTTFGIGVDYGVNIYQRYKLEGRGSLPKVLKTTGGAVALCSLTTIIGYFTLIIAKNRALVSFGWIAIIGEITCLVAALVFIPACVIYLEPRKAAAIAHPLESRSHQSTSLTSP